MRDRSRILAAVRVLAGFEEELGTADIERRTLERLRVLKDECASVLDDARRELNATIDRGRRVVLRYAVKDMLRLLAEIREAIGDVEYWVVARNAYKSQVVS